MHPTVSPLNPARPSVIDLGLGYLVSQAVSRDTTRCPTDPLATILVTSLMANIITIDFSDCTVLCCNACMALL